MAFGDTTVKDGLQPASSRPSTSPWVYCVWADNGCAYRPIAASSTKHRFNHLGGGGYVSDLSGNGPNRLRRLVFFPCVCVLFFGAIFRANMLMTVPRRAARPAQAGESKHAGLLLHYSTKYFFLPAHQPTLYTNLCYQLGTEYTSASTAQHRAWSRGRGLLQ